MTISLSLVVLLVGLWLYICKTTKWAYVGLVMFACGLLAFLFTGWPALVIWFQTPGARLH